MPSAAFTTLGCKVNQYETQKILDSFAEAGFEVVPFDGPADVYVVNTCSVTAQAEAKSRYTVRRARRLNPSAKVVVTGCAAQMELNEGRTGELADSADLLVPNPEKEETFKRFADRFPERLPVEGSGPLSRPPQGRTRATLKVQDGCDVCCSYCSIPSTRPGMRSRHWREVLEEAQALSRAGYQEAVLTGVLIGSYGPSTGSGGPDFAGLVSLLAKESGLARLRVSSIEAQQVDGAVIGLAAEGTIVPHLHIPLQSGDDSVLADMGRRYRSKDFLALCRRLYTSVPDLSITTDVMVGFPTETEERFERTIRVAEEARFLKVHVFRFSPRPGTPADAWGDPVAPQAKQDRATRLTAVSQATGREHVRRFLGRTMPVLLEGKVDRDGLLEGLTANWISVKLAGPASLARTLQWARLEEEREGTAYAELAHPGTTALRLVP